MKKNVTMRILTYWCKCLGNCLESPALEMLKNLLGKDTEQPTAADHVLNGGVLD